MHFSAATNIYTHVAQASPGSSENWMFIIAKPNEHKNTKKAEIL